MEATLPLLIRSIQKEVDLPAFEPDQGASVLSPSELWFESGVVSSSNAGTSTSFWRERISRGNVAFIDALGHLWLGVGVFPSLRSNTPGYCCGERGTNRR